MTRQAYNFLIKFISEKQRFLWKTRRTALKKGIDKKMNFQFK